VKATILSTGLLVAVGFGATGSAGAQQDPGCWQTWEGTVAPGVSQQRYDPQASLVWRQSLQMADVGLMGELAGTYYVEIPAPQLGMVSQQYRRYDANGLFEYQDQTCGNIPGVPCSQNYGHGQWTAYRQNDGSIFLMINWSDLSRTNACAGGAAFVQGGTIVGQDGIRWQRVQ
jgi:hypothetical protein